MKVKETLKKYLNRYFIDAMGAMALGLFASLLMSTIIGTVYKYVADVEALSSIAYALRLLKEATYAATGMAIGVAIAHKLGAHPLVMFSSAAIGYLANMMGAVIKDGKIIHWAVVSTDKFAEGIPYTAGPAGVFFVVIIAVEVAMLVSKKTKLDILVTPIVTLVVGFIAAIGLCPIIAIGMSWIREFIVIAMNWSPLIMGIVLSVVMGIVLTLPISSAAICSMIFVVTKEMSAADKETLLLAGGACVAGCCAQMIGFAVISFRENKWGGLVAQGLGTSMLQMGNIIKKPTIWIAPTLAAAVTGPLSTMVFKLKCGGVAAGMGTCGMVGPLGVIESTEWSAMMWIGLVLICLVLPAVLSLVFNEILRKLGWIKTGDMQLEL